MCLAQGPQHIDAGEVEPAAPLSWVKHSTTEALRFQISNGQSRRQRRPVNPKAKPYQLKEARRTITQKNTPLKTWYKLETHSTYTYLRSRWNSHGLVLYNVSLTTGEHDGRYCGFWTVRDGGTLGWGLKDKERISLGIALDKALFTLYHQLFQ